jgi:hypothetical protein
VSAICIANEAVPETESPKKASAFLGEGIKKEKRKTREEARRKITKDFMRLLNMTGFSTWRHISRGESG